MAGLDKKALIALVVGAALAVASLFVPGLKDAVCGIPAPAAAVAK